MQDVYQIDKSRMRQSFHRAAKQYDAAAILQRQVREEMLSRLDVVKLEPEVILDAGCGTGHGLHALLGQFKKVRVRFRRGSLRNGYHIQGRQQARKLPNPDTGR